MAIVVILLLLTANFQSVRLAFVVDLDHARGRGRSCRRALADREDHQPSVVHGGDHGDRRGRGQRDPAGHLRRTTRRKDGIAPTVAAVAGARGRLRPILMTSCAMIAGMVPMALGWSEGGEQSAPLGRAVIGGLLAATLATLIVLPTVFAIIQNGAARGSASIDPFDPQSDYFVADHAESAERTAQPGQWCDRGRFRSEVADRQENAGRYAAGRAGSCHLRLHKTVPGPDESRPAKRQDQGRSGPDAGGGRPA